MTLKEKKPLTGKKVPIEEILAREILDNPSSCVQPSRRLPPNERLVQVTKQANARIRATEAMRKLKKKPNIAAQKSMIMGVEMEQDSHIKNYWSGASSSQTTHTAKCIAVDIGTRSVPGWGGNRLGEISVRYIDYDTRDGEYYTANAKILGDVVFGFDRDGNFNDKTELRGGDSAWIKRFDSFDIKKLQDDMRAFAERDDVKQIFKETFLERALGTKEYNKLKNHKETPLEKKVRELEEASTQYDTRGYGH